MGEESFEDGLDWCLGEKGQPEYRCLGPSTVIVLLYAVGCVVVGFLVGFIVMQMDKSKAKKRKQSIDGDNIENKMDKKTRTLEEATEAFERSEHDGKFTGKKEEMRRMSHVSQGSRRGSVVSIQRSVPASPLLSRTAPPSSLVEEEKQS